MENLIDIFRILGVILLGVLLRLAWDNWRK